jgi:hypothetical protein
MARSGASLVTTVLEPKVAPIEFKHDLRRRRARVVMPGILETTTEPIKNLATGAPHVIDVVLPRGWSTERRRRARRR